MEVSREVSWTVPNIFQSKKLLRRNLLSTAEYLRPKGNVGKFNHNKRKKQQMWRRDILDQSYLMGTWCHVEQEYQVKNGKKLHEKK